MEWLDLVGNAFVGVGNAFVGAVAGAAVGPVVSYFLDEHKKKKIMGPDYLRVAEALDDFSEKCRAEIIEDAECMECMWPREGGYREYKRKSPEWDMSGVFPSGFVFGELPGDFQSEMKSLERRFLGSVKWVKDNIEEYHDECDVVDLYRQVYSFYGAEAVSKSEVIRKNNGLSLRVDGGEMSLFVSCINETRKKYEEANGTGNHGYIECRTIPELRG